MFSSFWMLLFILNTRDNLTKFDSKPQKCIMLGYSKLSKGYKVYNTETRIIEESIHVKFDDKLDFYKLKLVEKFEDMEISYSDSEGKEYKVKDFEDHQPKVAQSES